VGYGSELLVWYGDGYVQFMGIPVGVVDYTSARQTSLTLSAFTECNGADEPRQLNVSTSSETNCKRFMGLGLYFADMSTRSLSSSTLSETVEIVV